LLHQCAGNDGIGIAVDDGNFDDLEKEPQYLDGGLERVIRL